MVSGAGGAAGSRRRPRAERLGLTSPRHHELRLPGQAHGHLSGWTGLTGGREQVNEAAEGADAHDDNGPGRLGQETDAIGCREVHQAEQVEGNDEQNAEQERNQADRGRKSLHIRNVTKSGRRPLQQRCQGHLLGRCVEVHRAAPASLIS